MTYIYILKHEINSRSVNYPVELMSAAIEQADEDSALVLTAEFCGLSRSANGHFRPADFILGNPRIVVGAKFG